MHTLSLPKNIHNTSYESVDPSTSEASNAKHKNNSGEASKSAYQKETSEDAQHPKESSLSSSNRESVLRKLKISPTPVRGKKLRLPHKKEWYALKDDLKKTMVEGEWAGLVGGHSPTETHKAVKRSLTRKMDTASNAQLVKEAQAYIKRKMSSPRFIGGADGAALYSHAGTDLGADVIRTREGRIFRMVYKIDGNVRNKLAAEQGTPYAGESTELGRGRSGTVKIAEELTQEGSKFVAVKTFFDKQKPTADREYAMYRKLPDRHFSTTRELAKLPNDVHLFSDLTLRGDLIGLLTKMHNSTTLTQEQRDTLLRTIAQQSLQALSSMHAKGIYHQDVKPDNMLLSKDGTLVLTDFGTASTTEDGITTGTKEYMPPEAPDFDAPDPKPSGKKSDSDKFAMGRMLYNAAKNQGGSSMAANQLMGIGARLLDEDPAKRPKLDELLQLNYFKGPVYDGPALLRLVDNM